MKALLLIVLAGCSVEKLPPIAMVHRGAGAPAHRVVILPTECEPAEQLRAGEEPTAWCAGVEQAVASELAFHGMEIVNLATLPAQERTRHVIETSERKQVVVQGSMFSDLDVWQQRDAFAQLGIDGVVRISAAHTATWPMRTTALVQITRPSDSSLIVASVCELEVSRADGEAEMVDRAARCAIGGLP